MAHSIFSNPALQQKDTLKDQLVSSYPDRLNFGTWIGQQCQLGFYTIFYRKQDQEGFLITEDGNENIYDLTIPYDHRLNIITLSRNHTDSEDIEIRYFPHGLLDSHYDILYSNSTWTSRSTLIELGDAYENLGNAVLRFVITGTNTKTWRPRVNIQFLELPR